MKKLLIFLVLILFIQCTASKKRGVVDVKKPFLTISFSFNTEHYPWLMGTKYPQMALWIESNSSDVKTIFVTSKAGENDWFGADKRPSSLPVWYGALAKEGKVSIDSISGATPSGEVFTILWQVPDMLKDKDIKLFIEANVSFDYNNFYTKKAKKGTPGYNDVNGQPSIIWKSDFKTDDSAKEMKPKIAGRGHVTGENHSINNDLTDITTAKELFNYIKVSYSPGK